MDQIVLIQNIASIASNNNLSNNQVLHLMCFKYDLNCTDISAEELLPLVAAGYIYQNRITKLGTDLLEYKKVADTEEVVAINTTLPRMTEETANIVKRLSTHFVGNMFKGSDYSKYNRDCDNVIMAPFFFMFMNMFPSSSPDKNIHWNKHFNSTWTNVNLRRVTSMTTKKFKQVWKTKDIGLFLLGTYLFIKGSHNQEKNVYFVKSLENYWKEYDYWYDIAEEMYQKGELEAFTKPQKVQHNQFII